MFDLISLLLAIWDRIHFDVYKIASNEIFRFWISTYSFARLLHSTSFNLSSTYSPIYVTNMMHVQILYRSLRRHRDTQHFFFFFCVYEVRSKLNIIKYTNRFDEIIINVLTKIITHCVCVFIVVLHHFIPFGLDQFV